MKSVAWLAGLLALATLHTPARAQFISEILFNPDGTDRPHEYVELRGTANAVIGVGTYLVGIEGDVTAGSTLGRVQTIFNLSGLAYGANRFLVLLQNGNSYAVNPQATVVTGTGTGFNGAAGYTAEGGDPDIENASATWMLIQTAAAPTLANDIDANNDGVADGAVFAGWTILDSVAVTDGNNAGDRGYGAISFNEGGAAAGTSVGAANVTIGFTAAYVARRGLSTGYTTDDWFAADTDPGATPSGFVFEPVDVTLPFLANAPIAVMDLGGPNIAAVPEPGTLGLLLVGIAGAVAGARRRRAQATR